MIKLFMPEYAHIARIVIYQLLPKLPTKPRWLVQKDLA